jgi:hypothetical protein
MNELVRQTELFAQKSQPFNENLISSSIPIPSRIKPNEQIRSFTQNRESLLATNWSTFRSSTPPASTNHHLIDESLLERRTPPVRFSQTVEKPIPANPWLTDGNEVKSLLDHELTHLRETSSPWNSQNNSQQRDWNCFAGLESTKDLWNNSKWSSQSSTLTSTTSQSTTQSPWNDSFNQNLWNSKANDVSNTWAQFPNVSNLLNGENSSLNNTLSNTTNNTVDAEFNLFGQSLWSPLSGSTANTNISVTTNTVTTTQTSTSSTTWSFTPFTLFGSSSQSQYNRNNDQTMN